MGSVWGVVCVGVYPHVWAYSHMCGPKVCGAGGVSVVAARERQRTMVTRVRWVFLAGTCMHAMHVYSLTDASSFLATVEL